MVDIMIVNAAGAPGGDTGVHETDFSLPDTARVPSFFLYEADPLAGAMVISAVR
jgi:hypothetical protein